jgi:hypothetical protein
MALQLVGDGEELLNFLRFWRRVVFPLVPFYFVVALFVGAVKHSVPVIVNAGFLVIANTAFSADLTFTVVKVGHWVSSLMSDKKHLLKTGKCFLRLPLEIVRKHL